jgi:hypothetical protein
MTKTTFQIVAQELADAFEQAERTDGAKFYRIKDGAAGWIRSGDWEGPVGQAHDALDDRGPDDWVYEQCSRIADRLAECEDADDAREVVHECCDGLVDVYNIERVRWLALHLNNAFIVDEAVSEMGWPADGGLYQAVGYGQYKALEQIANSLIDSIESEAEERDAVTADEADEE